MLLLCASKYFHCAIYLDFLCLRVERIICFRYTLHTDLCGWVLKDSALIACERKRWRTESSHGHGCTFTLFVQVRYFNALCVFCMFRISSGGTKCMILRPVNVVPGYWELECMESKHFLCSIWLLPHISWNIWTIGEVSILYPALYTLKYRYDFLFWKIVCHAQTLQPVLV